MLEGIAPKAPKCRGGSREAGGGLSLSFVLQSLRHGKPCHLPLHKGGFAMCCETNKLTDKHQFVSPGIKKQTQTCLNDDRKRHTYKKYVSLVH